MFDMLRIWVELIQIQHYISTPALGPDPDLSVKKNRIWPSKQVRIRPSKKTGSEQNKTGTGSDSQNMNIRYKYIKFYLFHSARGSNPWPFEFCNSSLNQWAEKNRFIQVKNLIARPRFLAIFSSIWKNKIWSNKAFYNYSV